MLLSTSFEETLFLAKAQLNYGGDRELRAAVLQDFPDEATMELRDSAHGQPKEKFVATNCHPVLEPS